ncbi:uncharacterized protein LOC134788657 isoform X1 [Penaeus indicus]|uniref:uncharacterized protein LOC134788657 isoform X1 n=1 Tax=Penaeus indicus TaxID=29960 RepID=UPI00300CA80E
MRPESKDIVNIPQPNRRTEEHGREKLRHKEFHEQVCQDRREGRAHGNTECLREEATLKGKGIRLRTQTNQLEEDVGGQREMRSLCGKPPLKESEDVIKRTGSEQEVDIQTHHGRRRDSTDTGGKVLRVAEVSRREGAEKGSEPGRKRVRHRSLGIGDGAQRHGRLMGFRKLIEMRESRVDEPEPLIEIRLRKTDCYLLQATVESSSNVFTGVTGQGA